MPFKVAAFNVENLFDRARAFNRSSHVASSTINAVAELNALFEKANYTERRQKKMIELIQRVLKLNRFNESPLVRIRTLRGKIITRPRGKPAKIVAKGRGDWVGWAELKMGPVNEIAIDNTGRVIRDVDADIFALVEVENRVMLQQFSEDIVAKLSRELAPAQRPTPYENYMLIDGNDKRGIDVGIMTKSGFVIGDMRSHINDKSENGQRIFSRDCPEYAVQTPQGERIWILPNHFKSKFGGNDPRSIAKRRTQAQRVAEIYRMLIARGEKKVIVLGDLNDTPDSAPLTPLLSGTDLKDISDHPNFDPGPFNVPATNTDRGIGTFKLGNDAQKIDYLLLSPVLFARVSRAGMFRKGAWPGSRPPRWPVYASLKREVHVASDHHVLWAEIE